VSASARLLLIRTRCNRRDQGGNEIRNIAVGGLRHIMQTTVAVPEANIGYQGDSRICDTRIGQRLGEKAFEHMSLRVVGTLYRIIGLFYDEMYKCSTNYIWRDVTSTFTQPCIRVVL